MWFQICKSNPKLECELSSLIHRCAVVHATGYGHQAIVVRERERVSSLVKRLSIKLALNPNDWALYYLGDWLDENRLYEHYEIPPYVKLDLKPNFAEQASPAATQAPSRQVQSSLTTESTTAVDSTIEPPDARTAALHKLADASRALEVATSREGKAMLLVAEAKEDVERANKELSRVETESAQASETVKQAEEAVRLAMLEMATALGSGTV